MTTAGITSTSSANFKKHWVTYTAIALTSLALILISLQNFNSPHFQGLFKLGSTSLFALGCVGFLATSAIICCKNSHVNDPNMYSGDESYLEGMDAGQEIIEPTRRFLKKTSEGYYVLTATEAFRVASLLVNDQTLVISSKGPNFLYYFDQHNRLGAFTRYSTDEQHNNSKKPSDDLILRAVNARNKTIPRLIDNKLDQVENFESLMRNDEYLAVTVDGQKKYLQLASDIIRVKKGSRVYSDAEALQNVDKLVDIETTTNKFILVDQTPDCVREITYELLLLRQENLKVYK